MTVTYGTTPACGQWSEDVLFEPVPDAQRRIRQEVYPERRLQQVQRQQAGQGGEEQEDAERGRRRPPGELVLEAGEVAALAAGEDDEVVAPMPDADGAAEVHGMLFPLAGAERDLQSGELIVGEGVPQVGGQPVRQALDEIVVLHARPRRGDGTQSRRRV